MRRWVVLALAASPALPLAGQSVRGRLEGRIPSAAIPAVDSLIQFALQEGLPTEPLIQKALEGGAKHVAEPRIVAAVQLSLGQLRDARDLLIRAGDQPPVLPAEMTTIAWALRRGLPAPLVERVTVCPGSGCWTSPRLCCSKCNGGTRAPRRSRWSSGSCPTCRRLRSHRAETSPAHGGRRRRCRREGNLAFQSVTSRRDVARTSRVSTVKRARVARVIPPGGIET